MIHVPPAARSIVALAALASLSACSAQVGAGAVPAAQTVAVAVAPDAASLATGQATQFAASVTGTADGTVTWQVDEGGGGSVDATGLYTAPAGAGTYHVRALSHADPASSGVATVNVSAPPAGSVTISPKTVSVMAGRALTFTAMVNPSGGSVSWSVQEASGCGSITGGGVYTAPPAAATCHVVATSAADSAQRDVATVTVTTPIGITVSPTTIAMDACTSHTFTATVTGTSDLAVSWSVTEGAAGGTVTGAGVFTASANSGTYHVVATAHASSSATATATVTVQDHVLSIAVSPSSPSVEASGTQQFVATVTTTCGSFTAN